MNEMNQINENNEIIRIQEREREREREREKEKEKPIIKVRDLSFAYKKKNWILKNVSFNIFPGEIIALAGNSGIGKTTMGYILKGLIPHSIKGKFEAEIINVAGNDVRKIKVVKLAHYVGMAFQELNTQLFSTSVKEEIEFGLKNLKMNPQLAEDAMKYLGISDLSERMPMNLSAGQKQRVILASIIASHPKILILDEPGSHLDNPSKKNLEKWLLKLNKQFGTTIVIISQNPNIIGDLCDSILYIKDKALYVLINCLYWKRNQDGVGNKNLVTLWSDWKFNIHPLIKLVMLFLLNIAGFLPGFKEFRWILLVGEILLAFIIGLKFTRIKGFFKFIFVNFIGIYLLFYFIDLNWLSALILFYDYVITMLVMFLGVFIFVEVTPTRELLVAFRSLKIPRKFALAITIAITFLPLINDKIRMTKIIQESRGYKVHFWNLGPIIIPSLLNIIDLSINLSISLESRGFE